MVNNLLSNLLIHAHAYEYFDVSDVASGSLEFSKGFLSDMSPIVKIVIGILLGVVVISLLISIIKH